MERINNSNSYYTEYSEVLTSHKPPFNKNDVWIHKHDNYIEVKLFNKGWKTVLTTKDLGLSESSLNLVKELLEQNSNSLNKSIVKSYNKLNSDLIKTNLNLEKRIIELEDKINKLTNTMSNGK